MKKKRLFIIMIVGVIIGIASLYQTFAISSNLSGSGDVYTVSFNNDTKVNVPAGGNKTIYYRVKSNNNGTVKYGALYTGDNIVVKIYADSTNSSMDTINYKENKLLKLYIENTGSSDSTATLTTVFGYEHGGEIIAPDNYTLITEVYGASNVNTFANYISGLYTNASKTNVINNSITYEYDTTNGLMKDVNNNIRYYGGSPNNYVYFNCDDYSNQSSDTCEIWRIIGVFDGKVKLVRSESIGKLAWDMDKNINSSLTTYDNNWSTASLNRFLNTTYLNRGSNITYYSGKTGTTETTIDTSSIGIKSSTRDLISISTWYLRGDSSTSIKSLAAYQMERTSGSVYGSNPTEYISSTSSDMGVSKIAIPYPSDYGYAAEFGTSNCQQNFNQYSSSTNDYACKNKNWLGKIITNSYSGYSWLLTPSSSSSGYIWNIYSSGQVSTMNNSYNAFNVTPVLYLDSSVKADSSGDGSSSNPYRLSV